MFVFWDWVGGRYSLWSAIGLSIALSWAWNGSRSCSTARTPWTGISATRRWPGTLPVILALLGVWYNNFFGAETHAILPYDQYHAPLPAYFQQGDMESNGKSVDRHGRPSTTRPAR
jgi:glucose-6-phosphate isomerase